jgi:hypothetical protein
MVFIRSANVGEQLGRIFYPWDPSSQSFWAINRKKRCLEQEGFLGLGVDGSCKVELNFRTEKKQERKKKKNRRESKYKKQRNRIGGSVYNLWTLPLWMLTPQAWLISLVHELV